MDPEDDDDRISELPDDIILTILSKMPIKTAASTSVLSRRWKPMWNKIPHLDLDGRARIASLLPLKPKCFDNQTEDEIKRINSEFKSWVNKIIETYSGPSIHEFCLRYQLFTHGNDDSDHICRWLDFASKKGVQRLELDFSDSSGAPFLSRIWGMFIPTPTLESFTRLTSLSLKKVHLNAKVIDHFLYKCGQLEELKLYYVVGLSLVTISGPFPSLREIEIFKCHGDPTFVVSGTTLHSLTYVGKPDRLKLDSSNSIANLSRSPLDGY